MEAALLREARNSDVSEMLPDTADIASLELSSPNEINVITLDAHLFRQGGLGASFEINLIFIRERAQDLSFGLLECLFEIFFSIFNRRLHPLDDGILELGLPVDWSVIDLHVDLVTILMEL